LKKVKEENTKNILPRKVLKVVTESKEEYVRPPPPPGHRFHHPPPPFKVNYERTISTYNDSTVEFGEWKIVSK